MVVDYMLIETVHLSIFFLKKKKHDREKQGMVSFWKCGHPCAGQLPSPSKFIKNAEYIDTNFLWKTDIPQLTVSLFFIYQCIKQRKNN